MTKDNNILTALNQMEDRLTKRIDSIDGILRDHETRISRAEGKAGVLSVIISYVFSAVALIYSAWRR